MASTPADLPAELTNGPVVIKAWAPWCSSCRAVDPLVEHAATTSGVSVRDLRIDTDPDNLVDVFGVRSIPTLIGLRDGTEVARLTGAQPAETIESLFAATRNGTGTVTNQTPTALLALRAATGAVLTAAGFLIDTIVLVAVGAALIAWALGTVVRRRLE